ncbi:MAG: CHAT domain-containing protein [Candidatus Obscuribacterales bacterium]|jgi:CHAT domain-containing protein|nr:CHAT domain-containing protein [Candidatus Obscuribacterales bacterium]
MSKRQLKQLRETTTLFVRQMRSTKRASASSILASSLSIWLGISSGAVFAADGLNEDANDNSSSRDSMAISPIGEPTQSESNQSSTPSNLVRPSSTDSESVSTQQSVQPAAENAASASTAPADAATQTPSTQPDAAAAQSSTSAQPPLTSAPAAQAPVAKPAPKPLVIDVPQTTAPKVPTAVKGAAKQVQGANAAAVKAAAQKALAGGRPTIKTGPLSKQNEDVLKEVFALTDKPRTQESMDRIFSLEKEGQGFLGKGDILKALIKFQEMYAECKEVKYGDGEGRSLERMASVYLAKGEKTRAKSLIENSMEVLSNSQDKKSLGRTRVTAAQVYLALDNPMWALKQLELAMKDFNSSGVNDAEEAARAMMLAAELAVKIDEPKDAIKFYKAAAVYFGQAGNHQLEVNLHNTAAGMLQEMGLNIAALEEAQKSVSISRQQKNDVMLAASLTQLTSCLYSLCEYMAARKTIEEVQTLKLDGQPHQALAIMAEAYAFSLAATGSLDHARACLEKTWQMMKEGAPPFHKAQVLNALGVLNTIKGNHSIAIEQLRQAGDIQTMIGKGRTRLGLMIGQNLAAAQAKAGENRAAKAELEGVIRVMAKMNNPDPQILGQVYAALGEICFHLKEIPQAEGYIKKSIDVATKICDDNTLWRDYTNLARLQVATQQPAIESLSSAASHFRSPQAGAFFTAESNPYPATRDELASELVSMLLSANLLEQAFITAEQVKEEAFITEWQKNGGEVKSNDREIYNDLVVERAHLHAAELSRTPDHMQKRWQDWMRRHQLLGADNRELARLISPVPLNLQELVGKAQENQVTILDYLVGPKVSFVFTIDRQGRLSAAKLGVGRDQLKAQVSAVHQASAKSGPEARATEKRLLQNLYNELMPEHVQKFLPQNQDQLVAIVPDSVLFNLPFAALVDNTGKYVVESHTLTTLPAVLSFMDNGVSYGADSSLVFNAANETEGTREGQEATEISQLFQPDQVVKLVGKNADLAQLQEQTRTNNSVLHFSAPFLLQDSNLFKAALPIQSQAGTTPAEKKVTAETLFKSSLPSDLAVWSGTSVNPKDIAGGGVKILSRGLAYAGVKNVLLSLWVDQNAQRTEELLEFYRGRQQGLSQAQSLRKAQLLAISKDPSPRNWAAFQLIGVGK